MLYALPLSPRDLRPKTPQTPPWEAPAMDEREPRQQAGVNWPTVAIGGLLLILAVASINDVFLRVLAAALILLLTFYMTQSSQEVEVTNPLVDELRTQKQGLDRRKYGRLRANTDKLLEYVREMNRIAIQGREGKISQRHAHAELDRIGAVMRDLIDEVRKSAGVPTPIAGPGQPPGASTTRPEDSGSEDAPAGPRFSR